jgi:hypothetical protein
VVAVVGGAHQVRVDGVVGLAVEEESQRDRQQRWLWWELLCIVQRERWCVSLPIQ